MTKKILFFFISVAFIVALYGCHTDGHAPFANVNGINNIVVAPPAVVNEFGKFDEIVFNHTDNVGQTKITCENGTLQEGVVVEVKEVKTTTTALNQNQNVYIYTIDAYKETATGKTYVQSLEKPLTITLPTQHLGKTGICYVGIRYSENEPWQYRRVSEDGIVTLNARLAIASTNQLKTEYPCQLFRMGIQIALFLYKETEAKPEETTKIVSIDKITATSTAEVTTENKAYAEDLKFAISLEGENIGELNPVDIIVKVTYRSDSETPAEIKVNSQNVRQKTVKDDSVVKGKGSYAHSFDLPKVTSFSTSDSLKAKLDYVFSLKGIALSAFQNEFLVELNGVIPDGLIKSFGYSEYFKFDTKEKSVEPEPEPEPEPTGSTYTIDYNLDGGSLAEGVTNPSEYGEASETFTLNNPIKTGYTFAGWTGTDLEVATTEVTITTGSTGDREYTATWTENAPDTYTLTLSKGKGIATVTGAGSYEAGTSVTASCTMQEGYEFANWTGDITTEHFIMPEENATMTANATPIEYTISYIINGGEFAEGVASPTVYTVESEGFSVPTPTKSNYNFKAWYDKNGDSIATIVPGTTGDKILTASYTPQFFNITYDLAEGSLAGGATNPASYSIESSLITLNNPTRNGYVFIGWTGTDIEEGTASETLTIPTGSTGERSYTATWMKTDLVFDLGNGVKLYMNKVTQGNSVWYAGIFEVTQAQYYAVMGTNPSVFKGDLEANVTPTTTANYPVEKVSWDTTNSSFMPAINTKLASQLTAKGLTGYTFNLPSVEQWVYTCKAEGSDYCKGEDGNQVTESTLADYAWFGNSPHTTHDVGTKKPNYWGFYDMHGNVYEWCKDTYQVASKHVMRGGSYFTDASRCRSSDAYGDSGEHDSVGFRVFLMPATYTITLSGCDGATVDYTSKDYNVETPDFVLPQPTKTNYDFVGWIINNGDPATTVTISKGTHEDRTYTAKWTEAGPSADLTFDLADGVKLLMNKVTQNSEEYYMGIFEVTQEQYFAIMGTNPSNFKGNLTDASVNPHETTTACYPVEKVSWDDIMTANTGFMAKITASLTAQLNAKGLSGYQFTLPKQDQWKTACDAGTDTEDSNDNVNDRAWYSSNSQSTTHTVGTKTPNAWGFYDMRGNVWEWTLTKSGSKKRICGGSWSGFADDCRSSSYLGNYPNECYNNMGFRVVLVAPSN